MLLGFFRQKRLDLLERSDQKIRVSCQLERVQTLVVAPETREIAQPQRLDLVISAFSGWRKIFGIHEQRLYTDFRKVWQYCFSIERSGRRAALPSLKPGVN